MSPERRAVLAFFRSFFEEHHRSASIGEAVKALSKSRQAIHVHLRALVSEGFLRHATTSYVPTRKRAP